jgi:hypothetical protein
MKNIASHRFFQLTIICFFVLFFTYSWGSDIGDEEERRIILKKKLFLTQNPRENTRLRELILLVKENFISLQETSIETVQKFPFATRNQRKYPSLNFTDTTNNFDWLAYAQQLMLSYLEKDDCSLGDMVLYLKDNQKQFKFNEIECLFACTFQEIISYNELYYAKRRISDSSKIIDIQKAMCLHQVPVIVALSLSRDLKEKSCKILVLYDFNNKTQIFVAKDILQLSNGSIPMINISYMEIQLFALEAWVGYNSTLIPRPREELCIDPI